MQSIYLKIKILQFSLWYKNVLVNTRLNLFIFEIWKIQV